jgi:hypothetical protein
MDSDDRRKRNCSASSFSVALLNALYAYRRIYAPKETLAHEACVLEIERLHEPIGKQDQYAAAYGGVNLIEFERHGGVTVQPLLLPTESDGQDRQHRYADEAFDKNRISCDRSSGSAARQQPDTDGVATDRRRQDLTEKLADQAVTQCRY